MAEEADAARQEREQSRQRASNVDIWREFVFQVRGVVPDVRDGGARPDTWCCGFLRRWEAGR